MQFLYLIIVAGFGFMYYLNHQDKKKEEEKGDKQGMEASFGQEAPPSLVTQDKTPEELREEAYIKRFIPNYN
jgi:hypothetical protein